MNTHSNHTYTYSQMDCPYKEENKGASLRGEDEVSYKSVKIRIGEKGTWVNQVINGAVKRQLRLH